MTKNPYQLRVKDVMSKHVVAVDFGDTARGSLALMVENRVSSLPVLDGRHRCVGVLSATDLVDLVHEMDDEMSRWDEWSEPSSQRLVGQRVGQGLDRRTVDELMTHTVAAVVPETPLAETAHEMLRHRVHRLPVLDEQQRILGIVSTMDILTAFVYGMAE